MLKSSKKPYWLLDKKNTALTVKISFLLYKSNSLPKINTVTVEATRYDEAKTNKQPTIA
ncbi:hypothetical protein [Lederbergia ruris]|uniref:hypothetical protein n=1 Tax=Lederbergia ruris TaxID=217495 RepID=UPI00177E4149|nr:hypothetical protein [Lederbergia ruris]